MFDFYSRSESNENQKLHQAGAEIEFVGGGQWN